MKDRIKITKIILEKNKILSELIKRCKKIKQKNINNS